MILYYSPGACSLGPHISLIEAEIPYKIEKVDLRTKLYSGGDFKQINPKGYVPVLELPNGQRLTEGAVILQFIADQKPEAALIAKTGTWERYRVQEWLNYVATEIHKGFSILFNAARLVTHPEANPQFKAEARKALETKMEWLDQELATRDYLMETGFTVADAYLFNVLRWSSLMEIDLNRFSDLTKYMARMQARPAVKQAMQEQGLKI